MNSSWYESTLVSAFSVINKETGKVVERHFTEDRAQHAVGVLNDHEVRWGREPVYEYRKEEYRA